MAEGIRIGGGKKSGANVWARGNYTPPFTYTLTSEWKTYSPISQTTTFQITATGIDITEVTNEMLIGLVILNRNSGQEVWTVISATQIQVKGTYNIFNVDYTFDNATGKLVVARSQASDGVVGGSKATTVPEKFDLIDFVVNNNPTAYPNRGLHTDDYYYEKLPFYQSLGLHFMEIDENGYPTSILFNYDGIDLETQISDSSKGSIPDIIFITPNPFDCEVIANSIKAHAFRGQLKYAKKLKIKTSKIDVGGFTYAANGGGSEPKIWLSKSITEIGELPFLYSAETTKIYCEHKSEPTSGFNSRWNHYDGYGTVYTTLWGVTEEQFDAL